MWVIFIEEFERMGVDGVIAEARRVVGDSATYLSLDIDGLDPVFARGTGTPEVGGISSREALQLLRGLAGLNIMSADLVEVAPPYDPSGNTTLLAATLMYEQLCLLAGAARRGAWHDGTSGDEAFRQIRPFTVVADPTRMAHRTPET